MAAASTLDPASLECARSMAIDIIPERLRCATCDKLAVNAVKLPCCDNTICGDCHETLPATECPICTHSPFSADMRVAAKSLQTTVKVFIKTQLKKQGAVPKSDAKLAPATPIAAAETSIPAVPQGTSALSDLAAVAGGETGVSGTPDGQVSAGEGQAAPAVEVQTPVLGHGASAGIGQTPNEVARTNGDTEQAIVENTELELDEEEEEEDDDDDDVVITTERPEYEEEQIQQGQGDAAQYDAHANNESQHSDQNAQMSHQQGYGFDQQSMGGFGNGNFGNMGMNMNGFNPMMGMSGFGMGMPNMMNMPGMGMDPSMMFNGNFGGMGDMSSMMGMGMNGMGGGMAGMGDFGGMGGSGFFPNQGNYMQSNYGNAHRQNFSNDRSYGRGYGGRGFGRGARGNQYGRGRGGWGFQQQNQFGQDQQYAQNQPIVRAPQQSAAISEEMPKRRASPSYESGQGPNGTPAASGEKAQDAETNDDPGAAVDTDQAGDRANVPGESTDKATQNGEAVPIQEGQDQNQDGTAVDRTGIMDPLDGEVPSQIETVDHSAPYNEYDEGMQYQQNGYGHNNFGGRGGFRNRGGFGAYARGNDITELTPAPAPPVNAPTGPKAMRQGLPNTGWASRAAAQPKPTPTPVPEPKPLAQPVEPSKQDGGTQDRNPRNRSASHSHSRRRNEKERDEDYESDATYMRRKERERRKRKERDERHADDSRDVEKSSRKHRSRSESRTDDSSRRRHRDKDDEHRSSRSHRDRSKDRHSRRHRSRSPRKDEEDYSRRKNKGDDSKDSRRSTRKESRREDKYDDDFDRKDRSHRSSKHDRSSREDRDAERERPKPAIQPVSDELGFKIKGSKSAKANMAPPSTSNRDRSEHRTSLQETSATAVSTAAASTDPYAEERARAQQTREAKEAQRRQSSSSLLGKRSRGGDEEDFDAPTGPKGDRGRVKKGKKERRISYKFDGEVPLDDEQDAERWR